ncbi:hypothetical protein HGRIS_000307 [Hohenbuehelia grisea]|uniref:DUF6535 domain-containing protein n=1 Tax=Hohenbuehelia grisea TaxID=104357 RepID=A0ABR3JRU9_9AGAR
MSDIVSYIKMLYTSTRANNDSLWVLQRILETLQHNTKLGASVQGDFQARFWQIYKAEAEDYDTEFLKIYNSNLDIVLIFAGLFSAVSTTFIQGMVDDLKPDPADNIQAVLQLIAHSLNHSAFPESSPVLPIWTGPPSITVWTQSILYASLSSSLLAAFGAVLGKQWLNYYAKVDERGSIEARSLNRQQKLAGVERWHFRQVIDVLPLLLQLSLLLFGIGIAAFIWDRHHIVGGVVIAAVGLGVLFYTTIVISSLVSRFCPFQTPMGIFIRWMIEFSQARVMLRAVNSFLHLSLARPRKAFKQVFDFLNQVRACIVGRIYWVLKSHSSVPSTLDNLDEEADFPRLHSNGSRPPPPLNFDLTPPASAMHRAMAIAWIIETSTDLEIIDAAAKMVPTVEWPLKVDSYYAFAQLCSAYVNSVQRDPGDNQSDHAKKLKTFNISKALMHLYLERRGMGDSRWQKVSEPQNEIMRRVKPVDWTQIQGKSPSLDQEIDFISKVMHVVTKGGVVDFPVFPLKISQDPSWYSHLLPHILHGIAFSDSTKRETAYLISRSMPTAGTAVLVDLLLSAGILMGISVAKASLLHVDKQAVLEPTLLRLLKTFVLALPLDGKWDYYGTPAAFLFLEPICQLATHRDTSFSRVLHEAGFPSWCLQLSVTILQKEPPPAESRRQLRTRVGNRPFAGLRTRKMPVAFLPYDIGYEHNDELRKDLLTGMVLRSSITAAFGVETTITTNNGWRPSGQALWSSRIQCSDAIQGNLGPALLALGVRSMKRAVNTIAQASYGIPTPTELAMCTILALCSVDDCSYLEKDQKSAMLDLLIWSMEPSRPAHIGQASLRLVHHIRDALPALLESSIPRHDFFAALRSSSPQSQAGQYHFDEAFYQDLAYLQVVARLAQHGGYEEHLRRHISVCADIARAWHKNGDRMGEYLETVDLSLVDRNWESSLIWEPACRIFIECGWTEPGIALQENLNSIIFPAAWRIFQGVHTQLPLHPRGTHVLLSNLGQAYYHMTKESSISTILFLGSTTPSASQSYSASSIPIKIAWLEYCLARSSVIWGHPRWPQWGRSLIITEIQVSLEALHNHLPPTHLAVGETAEEDINNGELEVQSGGASGSET